MHCVTTSCGVKSMHIKGGGDPCLGFRSIFGPKHAQFGSFLGCGLVSPWPAHPVVPGKSSPVTCCLGHGIVADICKVSFKHAHCPEKHTIAEKPEVVLAVEWSIVHHQLTPPNMVDGMSYHGVGQRLPSMGWMHTSISGAHGHDRHFETAWKRSSPLKTQYLQRMRSHFLCILSYARRCRLWSKVNLRHLVGLHAFCVWPTMSRLHHKTLQAHPWDTLDILAISSAENLKSRISLCCWKLLSMMASKNGI